MKKLLAATVIGIAIFGTSVVAENSVASTTNVYDEYSTASDTIPRDTSRKRKKPYPDTTRPDSVKIISQR
ncbi:MAG: hypothetical protein H7Y27_03720 [Gemmatimonadaceae bacterium]|nr:hypothetical protein [Chitinophagaceae bacterium]